MTQPEMDMYRLTKGELQLLKYFRTMHAESKTVLLACAKLMAKSEVILARQARDDEN